MVKSTITENKLVPVDTAGRSINLTPLFRLAGLPHRATASPACARRYGLSEGARDLHHFDLAWAVRCAISGMLPVCKSTTGGIVTLRVEFPSYHPGKPEPVAVSIVVLTAGNGLHLVLPEELEAEAAGQPQVLVVEDNVDLAELIQAILEQAGFAVALAATGEVGLELAQAEHPGVVVLDIELPGMSGLEVCRRLKSNPRTADIPIVFCSGRSDLAELGARLGAAAWIPKPEGLSRLAATVRQALNGQQTLPSEGEGG